MCICIMEVECPKCEHCFEVDAEGCCEDGEAASMTRGEVQDS